jgi:hypothetical protein
LLEKSSKIFVLDKTPPEIAWMNEKHLAAFKNPKVSFQSSNLINPSKKLEKHLWKFFKL